MSSIVVGGSAEKVSRGLILLPFALKSANTVQGLFLQCAALPPPPSPLQCEIVLRSPVSNVFFPVVTCTRPRPPCVVTMCKKGRQDIVMKSTVILFEPVSMQYFKFLETKPSFCNGHEGREESCNVHGRCCHDSPRMCDLLCPQQSGELLIPPRQSAHTRGYLKCGQMLRRLV